MNRSLVSLIVSSQSHLDELDVEAEPTRLGKLHVRKRRIRTAFEKAPSERMRLRVVVLNAGLER